MKGIIARSLGGSCGLVVLASALGCHGFHRPLVDPCYPERYEYMARQEVNAAFAPQVANGHVLDQTIWNYHFEVGKETLTPGGMDHLAFLARRRPQPDPMIYLQTAYDLSTDPSKPAYDPKEPEKYAEARTNLDAKRIQEIHKFLSAHTSGRGQAFQVMVHDPSEVGMFADRMLPSIRRINASGSGTLGGGAGGTAGPAR